MILGKSVSLIELWFLHLQNENDDTYLAGLLQKLNEVSCVHLLVQYLANREYSGNASQYAHPSASAPGSLFFFFLFISSQDLKEKGRRSQGSLLVGLLDHASLPILGLLWGPVYSSAQALESTTRSLSLLCLCLESGNTDHSCRHLPRQDHVSETYHHKTLPLHP